MKITKISYNYEPMRKRNITFLKEKLAGEKLNFVCIYLSDCLSHIRQDASYLSAHAHSTLLLITL